MAIKGKSRSKGKGRGGAGAPRPVIVERKPPLLARRKVRWGLLVIVVLAVVLGGLRMRQNDNRSDGLRAYSRALVRAQGLMTAHFSQEGLTHLGKNATEFGAGRLDGKRFQELATLWQKDFRESQEAVSKLKPPAQAEEAQVLIIRGIEGYVGVARLYSVAAQQRLNADALGKLANSEKNAGRKEQIGAEVQKATDMVQVLLQHASESRARADQVFTMGTTKLDALKREWTVEAPSLSVPGIGPGPNAPGFTPFPLK